jgi:hypothetical protein
VVLAIHDEVILMYREQGLIVNLVHHPVRFVVGLGRGAFRLIHFVFLQFRQESMQDHVSLGVSVGGRYIFNIERPDVLILWARSQCQLDAAANGSWGAAHVAY